jgi:hypothetical protein
VVATLFKLIEAGVTPAPISLLRPGNLFDKQWLPLVQLSVEHQIPARRCNPWDRFQ